MLAKVKSEELVLSLESQKTLQSQFLAWNPCGWCSGYVWTTVTANAHVVWIAPVGQELATPCKSTCPVKPHLSFLPRNSRTSHQGLTSEVITTRLSRMLLVDQLWFLRHPFRWIFLWVLEHSGSLCDRGMIHTVDTLDPSLCQDQIAQGWGCCSETIAETYLSILISVMCWLLLHRDKQIQNRSGAGSEVEKTLLELGRGGFLLCLFVSGLVTTTVTLQIHFFPILCPGGDYEVTQKAWHF